MHLADFHYMALCSLTFMPLSVTSFVLLFALDFSLLKYLPLFFLLTDSSGALTILFGFSRIFLKIITKNLFTNTLYRLFFSKKRYI